MAGKGGFKRFRLSRLSLLALLLAMAITLVGVVGIRSLESGQENRLLKERAAEVALTLSQSTAAITERLKSQGAVLGSTQASIPAYEQAANTDVLTGTGNQAFAWLRPTAGGFLVIGAAGEGLAQGQVITGTRAKELSRALTAMKIVSGQVLGPERLLGFSLGPPSSPPGTVLYQETTLGSMLSPSRQANSQAFADLDVAVYGTPDAEPGQILVGPKDVPLTGRVARTHIAVGTASWLIVVRSRHSLIGSVSAAAPWFVLAIGLFMSVLIGALAEVAARRRDSAIALYDSERTSAETFQRSLLPELPAFPGLDVSARYLASGAHQKVGGDWFDAFPVADHSIGFVIGDVMGHDLVAAGGMAQVRSALRAYALDGTPPARVLDQLNAFVTKLEVIELATVVYGTLSAARGDGSRVLTWSNAGHLSPLLRLPDGRVEPLVGGESIIIGAPVPDPHVAASRVLPAGSSLLLFTDGLVEAPGVSLDEAIEALSLVVQGFQGSAYELCDLILEQGSPGRDDVAVLALQLVR